MTLQAITDAARDIIGAHQAVCSMTRRDGDWSQAINAVSLTETYATWRNYDRMPDGSGIYSWLCEATRTARMTQAELEAHPRWRGFGEHGREHPPMRGWLATALTGSDGCNLGLIQLSDKVEGESTRRTSPSSSSSPSSRPRRSNGLRPKRSGAPTRS